MKSSTCLSRLRPIAKLCGVAAHYDCRQEEEGANAEHFNRLCPTSSILPHAGLPLGLVVACPFLDLSSRSGPLVLHHEPSYFFALQMSITKNSASALVDPNNLPTAHPL